MDNFLALLKVEHTLIYLAFFVCWFLCIRYGNRRGGMVKLLLRYLFYIVLISLAFEFIHLVKFTINHQAMEEKELFTNFFTKRNSISLTAFVLIDILKIGSYISLAIIIFYYLMGGFELVFFTNEREREREMINGPRTRLQKIGLAILDVCLLWVFITAILFLLFFLQIITYSIIHAITITFQQTIESYLSYLCDWLYKGKIQSIDFHRGFNFSILTTIIVSMVVFLNMVKQNKEIGIVSKVRLFMLSGLFGLGLFTSLYSLLNAYYNMRSFDHFKNWFKAESTNGTLTLRFSSLVIFIGLISYIIKYVYNRRISFSPSGIRFSKNDRFKTSMPRVSDSDYSSIYFSQMGFYAIVFSILFYCYRINFHSTSTLLLNISLFFIIDDWPIIYSYVRKFEQIDKTHRFRLIFLNVILFSLGLSLLIEIAKFWVIPIYIICISFLLVLSLSNYAKINTFDD